MPKRRLLQTKAAKKRRARYRANQKKRGGAFGGAPDAAWNRTTRGFLGHANPTRAEYLFHGFKMRPNM